MLKHALLKYSDSDPEQYGNKTGTSKHLASCVQYKILLQCFTSNAIKRNKGNVNQFKRIQFTEDNQTKLKALHNYNLLKN